jgi:hypothetical protein
LRRCNMKITKSITQEATFLLPRIIELSLHKA